MGTLGQWSEHFTAKMYIACKEARETNNWLRLLVAIEIVPQTILVNLTDESNQLIAILASIVKKTKKG